MKRFLALIFFSTTVFGMEMALEKEHVMFRIVVQCASCGGRGSISMGSSELEPYSHDWKWFVTSRCLRCGYRNRIKTERIRDDNYNCSSYAYTDESAVISEEYKRAIQKKQLREKKESEKTLEDAFKRIISRKETNLESVISELEEAKRKDFCNRSGSWRISKEITYGHMFLERIFLFISNSKNRQKDDNGEVMFSYTLKKSKKQIEFLEKEIQRSKDPEPDQCALYSKRHKTIRFLGAMGVGLATGIATRYLTKKLLRTDKKGIPFFSSLGTSVLAVINRTANYVPKKTIKTVKMSKKLISPFVSLGTSVVGASLLDKVLFSPYSKRCKHYEQSLRDYALDCRIHDDRVLECKEEKEKSIVLSKKLSLFHSL